MKKYVLVFGMVTITVVYVMNMSFAVNDYGLSKNLFSLSILAQSSSSSGSTSGGSGTKYEELSQKDQNFTWKGCDGTYHYRFVEAGWKISCEGVGNVDCTPGWVKDKSKKAVQTTTGNCPGKEKCKINNDDEEEEEED